jgi:hypothetical protein
MKKLIIALQIILSIGGLWAGLYLFWNTECNVFFSFTLYVCSLVLLGKGFYEWEEYLKSKKEAK